MTIAVWTFATTYFVMAIRGDGDGGGGGETLGLVDKNVVGILVWYVLSWREIGIKSMYFIWSLTFDILTCILGQILFII